MASQLVECSAVLMVSATVVKLDIQREYVSVAKSVVLSERNQGMTKASQTDRKRGNCWAALKVSLTECARAVK